MDISALRKMPKKKDPIKNLLSYLPIITLALAMVGGFINFRIDAKETKTKTEKTETEVEKIKTKIEENNKETDKEIEELKEDNQDLDKSLEVSKVQQENIKREVEKTNEKIDKVIDILVQMQKKK